MTERAFEVRENETSGKRLERLGEKVEATDAHADSDWNHSERLKTAERSLKSCGIIG